MIFVTIPRVWWVFSFLTTILITLSCSTNHTFSDGKELYTRNCAGCHGDNGEGLKALIPPLAGTDWLQTPAGRASIPCIIRNGLSGAIVVNGQTYNEKMAAIPSLNPVEITNIVNYLTYTWGAKMEPMQLEEVNSILKQCGENLN